MGLLPVKAALRAAKTAKGAKRVDVEKLKAVASEFDPSQVPVERLVPSTNVDVSKLVPSSPVKTPPAKKSIKVHHGTFGKFSEFKQGEDVGSFGFHFGSKEAASAREGVKRAEIEFQGLDEPKTNWKVDEYELNIENPLRLDENRTGRWEPSDIVKAIQDKYEEAGKVKGFSVDELEGLYDDTLMHKGQDYYELYTIEDQRKFMVDFLESKGYDSIVYDNVFEGGKDSYMVFDPKKITKVDSNE